MIYSVVPYEQIFYNSEDNAFMRMEVSLHGERVVLMKNHDNTYTIERLLSTNPKAYLRPELSPGTLIMNVEPVKNASGVTWEIMNT
ncbi:MAG: hypothetical protein GX045_00835 [Clostridiaceae bacterium]|jgi:hypothetical protein|nr:hypothetical protein [Clostridiaceae bacterium]